MCRIIIILKNNNFQKNIVNKFLNQAYTKKNTPFVDNDRDFNYHQDGYGFIFYNNEQLSTYKSSLMFDQDNNFCFIEDKIANSYILIGHIRATKHHFPDDICFNNTHPFWYENNFLIHNGSINPFNPNFFTNYIDTKYYKHIKGTTDSELLFYILLTIYDNTNNFKNSWIKFFKLLRNFIKFNIVISANIVFVNKDIIYISRFINNNEEPPSLYIDKLNLIISSEPVTDIYEIVEINSSFLYNMKIGNIEKIKI